MNCRDVRYNTCVHLCTVTQFKGHQPQPLNLPTTALGGEGSQKCQMATMWVQYESDFEMIMQAGEAGRCI